jgi:acetyl esterase/lipase
MIKRRYGEHPSQYGELYLPAGRATARRPATVVIIHGGFWRAVYTCSLGRPLAVDLAARGYAVWNLEYRRVGNGGGWPGTLADVAQGIDHLAGLDVDTTRVVAVGHSAGGQLAVWAAGRRSLAEGAPGAMPRVGLAKVIAQAGVLDLTGAATGRVGGGAVAELLGGMPEEVPQRYALADPMHAVPLDVPVVCLHSRRDEEVPFAQSAAYVAAARNAGADARLVETTGDHYTMIDPAHPDWGRVVENLS